MARYDKNRHDEIRAAIQAALDDGCDTPSDVMAWLESNGCDPMPTRNTVIVIMAECGFEYVSGYWVRTK